MKQFYGSMKVDFYYNFYTLYPLFVSHTVLALLSGFILSMLVEIPCSKLQRNLMNKLMKGSKHKNAKDKSEEEV